LKTTSLGFHTFTRSLLLAGWALALPAGAQDRLASLAGDGSVLLHAPNGEALVSINPHRSLVPASLIKIPLAQVALTALSEDFRFETQFYRNDSGDLLIRGLGDPFLVSEEIALIADSLARSIIAPQQLPVGVVTAIIGVPTFLIILRSTIQK